MTTITAIEITEGNKSMLKFKSLMSVVISILWLPFTLVGKMFGWKDYCSVNTSSWTDWYSVNGQTIERKIVAETGFDGVVKFYNLRTLDEAMNRALQGRVFGEFHWETHYGLFLREFKTLGDWPTSYLVFIDKKGNHYKKLIKTNSSWTAWKCEFINESDFSIITEPADSYTKRIKIALSKEA